MLRLTPAVKNLLILNGVVFLLFILKPGLRHAFALYHPYYDDFRIYQVLTHFFSHADFSHLAFNMLVLVIAGPIFEMRVGEKRFYIFFAICALGAAFIHMAIVHYEGWTIDQLAQAFYDNPEPAYLADFVRAINSKDMSRLITQFTESYHSGIDRTVWEAEYIGQVKDFIAKNDHYRNRVLGASGATSGLILAAGLLYPNMPVRLYFVLPEIPMKWVAIGAIVGDLFMGFMDYSWDNVAHWAHLGGMLFAYILIRLWHLSRPDFL